MCFVYKYVGNASRLNLVGWHIRCMNWLTNTSHPWLTWHSWWFVWESRCAAAGHHADSDWLNQLLFGFDMLCKCRIEQSGFHTFPLTSLVSVTSPTICPTIPLPFKKRQINSTMFPGFPEPHPTNPLTCTSHKTPKAEWVENSQPRNNTIWNHFQFLGHGWLRIATNAIAFL
jgi:hypothetical protein